MSKTTPRQVLYALVAAGFVLMVIVLVIGAAVAGPVPTWWSATMASLTGISAVWMTLNWRRTRAMLAIGIGLFLVWTAGTLM